MAASKRFGMYKKEEKKEVREADVNEERTLKRLKEAWTGFDYDRTVRCIVQIEYEKALSLIGNLDYSAHDLERFSIILADFQNESMFSEKAGLFLSALINSGRDMDFKLFTRHLDVRIDQFGGDNTKNITIIGGLGFRVGYGMKRGSIVIEGDVGGGVGTGVKGMEGGIIIVKGNALGAVGMCMKGGKIIVEGNVSDSGEGMEGGEIIIKGNVGEKVGEFMKDGIVIIHGNAESVGYKMEGGEIHVEGEIGKIGNVIHGKIFHRGKLIVDK